MVNNLPDGEDGFATADLFEPHPTIPDLWRVYGSFLVVYYVPLIVPHTAWAAWTT